MLARIVLFALAALVALVRPCAADGVLTLPEVLRRVRAVSPRREAAEAVAGGARTAVPLAGRPPNPSVELRSENWTFHRETSGLRTDYFAVLTLPIEFGGKAGARERVASAEAEIAGSVLRDTDQQLVLEATERYLGAVLGRGLVEALEQLRRDADEVLRIVTKRAGEGTASESDVAKFAAELALVEDQLARARLARDRAGAGLDALLLAPGTVAASRLVRPSLPPPPEGDLHALARAALEHRPDVAVARAKLAHAKQQAELERTEVVPTVNLSGGWKRTAYENTGVLALSVPLPVLNQNGAAIAVAEAAARAASRELVAVEASAQAETLDALRIAHELGMRARRAESRLVEPAAVVLRATRATFREGDSDVLRLVDAERVYADARREALALEYDAFVATVRARLALGEDGAEIVAAAAPEVTP